MSLHPRLIEVTERIKARSQLTREAYLQHIQQALNQAPARSQISCTNLAHTYAALHQDEKLILRQSHRSMNIAIISAYNELLSAHAPYRTYPDQLKQALIRLGHTGQMAAGVPAMCDGVTQGQLGMELSLFSRDVIALSTAIALSHQVFDGSLLLGICDKIVPGLLMAALRFGHLPAVFVPSGPMPSGISNSEKARTRQDYAAGKVDEQALLDSEMASYHSVGTCTFYGTANSNQMLLEMMGLQLPGSSFVPPDSALRHALTDYAAERLLALTTNMPGHMPLGQMLDERSLVNAVVGLLATGGSTNHTIHLIAIARMAGIELTWQDMADLSAVVPLLARVYPNGREDINAFQQAGGMGFLMRELAQAGLLHTDVQTIMGHGLDAYYQEPFLDDDGQLQWRPAAATSLNLQVLAPSSMPFMAEGGLALLSGNLGRGVMKVSAVAPERWHIRAPARVFSEQQQVLKAYEAGELNQDVVVVLKDQGPRANGMPELHQLMPALSNLQDAGFNVALVTDGRLSGASGKVPAVIHLSPEAQSGGPLACVRDGDVIELDARQGRIHVCVEQFDQREATISVKSNVLGLGRELFTVFRQSVGPAERGAIAIGWDEA